MLKCVIASKSLIIAKTVMRKINYQSNVFTSVLMILHFWKTVESISIRIKKKPITFK